MAFFFVNPIGVGVEEHVFCFCFSSFLPLSPCTHRTCAFLMESVAHHCSSLIQLLHAFDSVILMRLDLLTLAFQQDQVLSEVIHFLLISISFSMATSSVDDYTITFSTQTWLHLGESNSIKSMQEVNESFLIISKSEILLRALVGVFALASSFSSLLVSSTFKFAKKTSNLPTSSL